MRNEKEYCLRRSAALREQMIQAAQANDREAFTTVYNTAQRYMLRGELREMMVMWITRGRENDVRV